MFYDRKIKYFDYLENGDKIRNAGFVKIEATERECNILINVKGLYKTDTMQRDIWISDGSKESVIGSIKLESGVGSFRLRKQLEIPYKELQDIRIPLSKDRVIYCKWGDNIIEYLNKENTPKEDIPKENLEELELPEVKHDVEKEVFEAEKVVSFPEEITVADESSRYPEVEQQSFELLQDVIEVKKNQNEPMRMVVKLTGEKEEEKEDKEDKVSGLSFHEDKWKQLFSIYPHITPFQDEREYLSIGPNDFVVFHRNHHKLVNNSFLLHGYYNYDHLILTRIVKRGEERYYLGVPGNFYDREKQVAIMFGFESFECKEEPAKEGDFGYYMIQIEI